MPFCAGSMLDASSLGQFKLSLLLILGVCNPALIRSRSIDEWYLTVGGLKQPVRQPMVFMGLLQLVQTLVTGTRKTLQPPTRTRPRASPTACACCCSPCTASCPGWLTRSFPLRLWRYPNLSDTRGFEAYVGMGAKSCPKGVPNFQVGGGGGGKKKAARGACGFESTLVQALAWMDQNFAHRNLDVRIRIRSKRFTDTKMYIVCDVYSIDT